MLVVGDARSDERFCDNPLVTGPPAIRFYAGAPIDSPTGFRLGTLCAIDNRPRTLDPDQIQGLRDLADMVEREIALAGLALTDHLTGLANRRAFREALRESDLVARLGGDEMAVLLYDTDEIGAETVARSYRRPSRDRTPPAPGPVGDETAARLVSHSMNSTADAPSIDTIVVGVDASETALAAVKETAALARQLGARLHIVSAVGSEQVARGGSGTDSFRSTSLDRALQTLADVASRLRDLEVTTAARKGKPADVIVAEAEDVDADLIVVGSRRMSGIGRALGSIANDVAHHAPCSVYIAKTTG